MTKTEGLKEITYWVIDFTGIDGKKHTLSDGTTDRRFTRHYAAIDWIDTMPEWQKATERQVWDYV